MDTDISDYAGKKKKSRTPAETRKHNLAVELASQKLNAKIKKAKEKQINELRAKEAKKLEQIKNEITAAIVRAIMQLPDDKQNKLLELITSVLTKQNDGKK